MTKPTDLHEILAIYFDLTDRPNGSKLVMGDLNIEKWVADRVIECKEHILRLERQMQENPDYTGHAKKFIKKYQERLERAEYWQERGYGL